MNTKLLLITFAMFSFLLFNSCSEEEAKPAPPIPPTPELEFKIDSVYLKRDVRQTSGVIKIPVVTNLDWDTEITFSSDQEEWCSVDKDDVEENHIRISYEKSEEAYVRTANITIKSSVQEYTILVRQLGFGPTILINSYPSQLSADGGIVDITITANVPYSVSKSLESEWLTEITTKGLKDSTYHWQATANLLSEKRIAVLYYNEVNGTTKDSCIVQQLGFESKIVINSSPSELSADGDTVEIKVTANVPYSVSKSLESEWLTEITTKGLKDSTYRWLATANPLAENRIAILYYNELNGTAKDSCVIIQKGEISQSGSVEVLDDISVKPSSGVVSEQQGDAGIEKTWDGLDAGGVYHSTWHVSAKFPVIFEYFFDDKPDLDYLIYHPTGGNGNFGKLKIYTATESSSEYSLLGDYNFRIQNGPSKVLLPNDGLKKVTKIKFSVESGGSNFVSCKEMEFFQKNIDNPLDEQLLSVFTDLSCSELKIGVTTEVIYRLPSYFAQLAVKLKDNEYDAYEKSFRIREYEAYSDVEVWAEKLMTKKYSNLDNCTGIWANVGDSILVLVGNTYGCEIKLQSIEGVLPSGATYFLKEGVNKIHIRENGMLFLMYTTTLPARPIRVHIPFGNGIVDGFFDLEEHKTDAKYAEIIQKASHKYFFIRGKKHIFYFHRETLLEIVPNQILSAVHLWDDMVSWQQELMGVDDVRPLQVNNHMMAVSVEDGYMWASDYRMGYIHTYLENILLKDNVMAAADNAWGPAHEMGHVHQQAINWPTATESSNNLFSNYAIYKLGKYCSRGSELSVLAYNRFIKKFSWAGMYAYEGGGSISLHLRMNWQLWNYFHRCGHNDKFWQTLFKELRKEENRIENSNPGEGQMKFASMACKAANQDLTEFFEMWGFFEPFNDVVGDYGNYQYTVTQQMINEVKAKMATYPPMEHAFQYIEDRKNGDVGIFDYQVGDVGHYTQFEGQGTKITGNVSYILNGRTISISNGEKAVAFEIKKDDKLIYFSNFLEFDVPNGIPATMAAGMKLYAVQSDGIRKEINNTEEIIAPVTQITVTPSTLTLFLGKATRTLKTTITPSSATNNDVTWSSNDETVAKVNALGVVSQLKAGKATITATADGRTASCVVTVKKDPSANEGLTEGEGVF